MSPIEAGTFRRRPTEANAIRVREVVKQPSLEPRLKTNLPEWVRDAFERGRLRLKQIDGSWLLEITTVQGQAVLSDRAEWLLQNPTDRDDLWPIAANVFAENYVRDGEPLTERERKLEKDLKDARAAAEHNYRLYERAHPGELPGRDTMG
jgi:hypothetical protein